jgi:hypothetical protein
MVTFAYYCRGWNLTPGSRKRRSSRHVKAAAERASLIIEELLRDPEPERFRPFLDRPQAFALDQRLANGDAVVLSLSEFGASGSTEEELETAFDVMASWARRGARVVLVESPEASAKQMSDLIQGMAGIAECRRAEERIEAKTGNNR